jgi:hypothetical protein
MAKRPGVTRRPTVPTPGWWTCHIEGCPAYGQRHKVLPGETPQDVYTRHDRDSPDPGHYQDREAQYAAALAAQGRSVGDAQRRGGMDRQAFEATRQAARDAAGLAS